ncbi:MAG: hypothetical protein K2H90_05600, partial [Oscillospiraceae bacterium]|nr:hypothetical protein [Oscillospiraceae bacterium]
DGEGNLLKSDGKAELKTMVEGYIDRLNTSSATFEEIEKEYNDYYADLVNAATETTEENTDTAEQSESEAEDTAAYEPDYGTVVAKDSSYPSSKVVEAAFYANGSDCVLIEDDDNEVYYLVQTLGLFDDPEYLENNRESVLHTLKDEEFNAEVESWTEGQNVVVNQDSFDRYKLDKILE